MNYFKSFLLRHYKDILLGILVVIIGILIYFVIFKNKNFNDNKNIIAEESSIISKAADEVEEEKELCHIDIKGQVKKTGVYEISCNSNISDAIKLAGGLKKNAYTDNINLSKTIKDEMVIYIYSKSEIKSTIAANETVSKKECESNTIYINDCTEEKSSLITTTDTDNYSSTESETMIKDENEAIESNDSNTKTADVIESNTVNINTASKEELMSLNGIGESKALSIIEYRTTTKFEKIEDIKNVSGIGDALYEKIKDNISVN